MRSNRLNPMCVLRWLLLFFYDLTMHFLFRFLSQRSWRAGAALLLALSTVLLAATQIQAQTRDKAGGDLGGNAGETAQVGPVFEAPTWAAQYQGQIAGKRVEVQLWRLGDALMGSYCYLPCRPEGRIDLQGMVEAGAGSRLTETPALAPKGSDEAAPSGQWLLTPLTGRAPVQIQGRWQSMDGKKQWPLRLQQSQSAFAHAPQHELRLVLERPIRSAKDCDFPDNELQVSAIRIYGQGRLLQTLATQAYGSCGLVQPQWVDANFDGWPDLTQALALPAGPNIAHTTWLYEPAQQRFVLAPPALQDITSPSFDGQAARIYNYWRGSCCSHGVDIYAWQGGQLVAVEQAQSYVLPVRQNGRLMGCYIMPAYERGHVAWPDALYQTPTGLAMGKAPGPWCDIAADALPQQTQLQVLAPPQAGRSPRVQAAYAMSYLRVDTPKGPRYCPDLPVFDADARKVLRVTLTQDAEQLCELEKPQ